MLEVMRKMIMVKIQEGDISLTLNYTPWFMRHFHILTHVNIDFQFMMGMEHTNLIPFPLTTPLKRQYSF